MCRGRYVSRDGRMPATHCNRTGSFSTLYTRRGSPFPPSFLPTFHRYLPGLSLELRYGMTHSPMAQQIAAALRSLPTDCCATLFFVLALRVSTMSHTKILRSRCWWWAAAWFGEKDTQTLLASDSDWISLALANARGGLDVSGDERGKAGEREGEGRPGTSDLRWRCVVHSIDQSDSDRCCTFHQGRKPTKATSRWCFYAATLQKAIWLEWSGMGVKVGSGMI